MLLRQKDEYWAKHYLEQAKDAYTQIEMYGKVEHMVQSNKLLQPSIDLNGLKLLGEEGPATDVGLMMDATLETESMS